jgi:DNA ligase (NAD+)
MDNAQREATLVNLITKAKQAYYFSGEEIMSDAEYDALEDELSQISPNHPLLKTVGAPVPESGQHLSKVKHRMMMGSQGKVNTPEEFAAWCSRREMGGGLHCSLKADGCSIAAYYENGRLRQVVTRGDGDTGEDVTANALSFKGLPAILGEGLTCAVRLEAVMTVQDWEATDPEKTSNPRSLANGILGRKDGKNANRLTALAFDVEGVEDLSTEEEKSLWLESKGFATTSWTLVENAGQVQSFLQKNQQSRDSGSMNYWADGVVVKINSLDLQRKLGVASGRPKGQVAWKFSAEKASTEILDVEWTVGHTGAVTPVAKVAPVRLGGTTVQRVSLANPELIEALGIRIGSYVEVVKAGDIIPKITRVTKSGAGKAVETPCQCPDCDSALQKMNNVDGSQSTVIYCRNADCEAQTSGRIRRWAKSRDVLGLGDSVIEALCSSDKVKSVPDLFELKADDIKDIVINSEKNIRLGGKRAESICQEIAKKGREMTLPEFLGSFGTRKLGVRRASLMLEANPQLADIERWFDGSLAEGEFATAAGVPNSGIQILEGLKEREDIIRRALSHVKIVSPQNTESRNLPTICITGSLPSGKKKHEWEKPLADAGYKLVDTVTKDLYALVVSDPSVSTSKSQKAQKMGVTVMSEGELEKLCKSPSPQIPHSPPLPRASLSPQQPTHREKATAKVVGTKNSSMRAPSTSSEVCR